MTAYVIFLREGPITDPGEMETYRKKGHGSQAGFEMKPLAVYGPQVALEGKAPEGAVILEFPNMEEAQKWYNGPYSLAAPHRRKAAEYRGFIVDGWTPPKA